MFAKKFQAFAQVVGYVTIGLLAVYGLVTLLGGGPAMAAALDTIRAAGANPVIPATFNYQGLLRNPDGSLDTGVYTITAKIYDLAVDGSTLYTETFPNVTARDGLFNIVLGDDPQGQNLQAAFSTAPRYIGLTLVGQGTELIPRQRLHGVPWALYATNASQANDFIVTGLFTATTITASGPATVAGLTVSGNAAIGSATVSTATIGTATVSTATIGTATVNGDISTSGNISWTGHLQGMTLSGRYTIESIESGTQVRQMLPTGNNMCFLELVYFNNLNNDGEYVWCNVVQESGYWWLQAQAEGTLFNNAYAKCEAICLQW